MFCSNCGKEIANDSKFCACCGKAVASAPSVPSVPSVPQNNIITTLSERVKINAIIWLVIAVLQILGGIFINWFLLIVGVLNIVSAINDIKYSNILLQNPTGVVEKFESLTGPIITLIYNLVIGGVIGVAGSIYYFLGIRNFVMEHKNEFLKLNK